LKKAEVTSLDICIQKLAADSEIFQKNISAWNIKALFAAILSDWNPLGRERSSESLFSMDI